MANNTALGVTFALTATADELDADDNRPCAYCNSDECVSEREHVAYERAAEQDIPEFRVPDDVGLISAEYVLRFGHKNGAGVEVPVCDTCLVDVPVEHAGQTTHSELDFRYSGQGNLGERIVENTDGQVVHRTASVDVQ